MKYEAQTICWVVKNTCNYCQQTAWQLNQIPSSKLNSQYFGYINKTNYKQSQQVSTNLGIAAPAGMDTGNAALELDNKLGKAEN